MESKTTLYFRNIPPGYSQEQMTEVFEQFGVVNKLFIHRDGSYGMVDLDNPGSSLDAMTSLHNQPPLNLYVKIARNSNRQSDKQFDMGLERSPRQNSSFDDFGSNMSGPRPRTYYENEIIYVDRFNKVVQVLETNDGEIYVPLNRVTGIRKVVHRRPTIDESYIDDTSFIELPADAIVLPNDDALSQTSSDERRVRYNNDNLTVEVPSIQDRLQVRWSDQNRNQPESRNNDRYDNRPDNRINDSKSSGRNQNGGRFNKRFQNEQGQGDAHVESQPSERNQDGGHRLESQQFGKNLSGGRFNKQSQNEQGQGSARVESPSGRNQDGGHFNKRFQNEQGQVGAQRFNKQFQNTYQDNNADGFKKNEGGNIPCKPFNPGQNKSSLKKPNDSFNKQVDNADDEYNSRPVKVESCKTNAKAIRFADSPRNNETINKKPEVDSFNQQVNNAGDEYNSRPVKVESSKANAKSIRFADSPRNNETIINKKSEVDSLNKQVDNADDECNSRPVKVESSKANAKSLRFADSPRNNETIINNKSELFAEENIPELKTVELPKGVFTQVMVIHKESDTVGYVSIVERLADFGNIVMKLIQDAAETKDKVQPEVGKLCIAKYDDFWFRAIVICTSPVTVRYIDYGNTDIEPAGGLKPLPAKLLEYPIEAILIRLENGAPCQIENEAMLMVKPIRTENDEVIVHVENGIYDENEEEASSVKSQQEEVEKVTSKQTPCALTKLHEALFSRLDVGGDGLIEYTKKLSNTQFVASLMPNNLGLFVAELEETSLYEVDPNLKPKAGDLVGAYFDEKWYRSYVIDVKHHLYNVAFIDYGTVNVVEHVGKIPENHADIPQFSCVCVLNEAHRDKLLDRDPNMLFEITYKSMNKLTLMLSSEDSDICPVDVYPWIPSPDGTVVPILSLKNGENVKLIREIYGVLYVRTKEAHDLFQMIEEKMLKYSSIAPSLSVKPKVGDLVAAEFEGGWYRASVTATDDINATVIFVDYGDIEIKLVNSLRALSEDLKSQPITLLKIKLKGFVDKPFSQPALKYLESLVSSNKVLTATYEDSVEKGVDLTCKDGTNVTEEITKLCVKSPGKNDPKVHVLEMNLEVVPVGEVEIKYLYEVEPCQRFCFCLNNPETHRKTFVELGRAMNYYVKNIAPQEPYTPEEEEIIIAKNEGNWCRALCSTRENGKFNVFFVDYGKPALVSPDDIRRIPQEFAKHACLANFGEFAGIPETPSVKLTKCLKNLSVTNNVYKVRVLRQREVDNTYEIEFTSYLNLE